MKFAALKKKLSEEGLFDHDRKQNLPSFPLKIVVISSPTGAAIHDFLKICKYRNTPATIQIFPVPVQGDAAAPEIARAIDTVNRRLQADIIVLCRGGGSLEDLWAFNEECVARAIARSKIPIISGVGHEIDTTIADLCADVRAPTPTGAAEMIIPDATRLKQQILVMKTTLRRVTLQKLNTLDREVAQQSRHIATYRSKIENLSLRVDLIIERLQQSGFRYFSAQHEKLRNIALRLERQAPRNRIEMQAQSVRTLHKELVRHIMAILSRSEDRLARTAALLHSVSPLSTLSRGYAIVQVLDEVSGELLPVSKYTQVKQGDEVNVLLHEGSLRCEVLESIVGNGK
jgi:exodeoxyribonuclease VII large subunit